MMSEKAGNTVIISLRAILLTGILGSVSQRKREICYM